MNQTRATLCSIWSRFQSNLFPWLEEELGELTGKQQKFVETLDLIEIERYISVTGRGRGRPSADRASIARSYIAKAVYNLSETGLLLERLRTDKVLRRLCGWERVQDLPSQSTFSRAFAEFAQSELAQRVHEGFVNQYMGQQLVGHLSRDSTAIVAREKPQGKAPQKPKRKRGRPKKGEEVVKEPTRLERQSAGMSLEDMKADLPTGCNVGTKRNSKGHQTCWIGYKLHIDSADGGIPISCLLTSASVHDSQVAIPLSLMSHQRVTSCYDLMDAAYDAPQIREQCVRLGHVPLIDENPRKADRKAEIDTEKQRQRRLGYKTAERVHYNERSTVERVNARLKDEFGGRFVRVKGHAKVMAHLMFGILALTANQLMKFLE